MTREGLIRCKTKQPTNQPHYLLLDWILLLTSVCVYIYIYIILKSGRLVICKKKKIKNIQKCKMVTWRECSIVIHFFYGRSTFLQGSYITTEEFLIIGQLE